MIDINITQAFCSNLEEMYCEIIREVYNKENVRIKINNEDGKIYCSNSSKSNVSFLDNTLNANEINLKISEIQKNNLINYMANMLYECKDLDDDTVASLFVSCCYFGYLWDIFSYNTPEKIIEALCSSLDDAKLKEYLSNLGIGILNRGYSSELSTKLIKRAIEIYPENEMSKLFILVCECINFDKYLTDMVQKTLKSDEEYNIFSLKINKFINSISEISSEIDNNLEKLTIQSDSSSESEQYCISKYTLYLPYICSRRVPNGVIESMTSYKNSIYFINPSMRQIILKRIMPPHSNYLSDNFESDVIEYKDKKEFIFFGTPLFIDIFSVVDYFRLHGNDLMFTNKQLDEKNNELKRLQRERENLFEYHAHSWKHISFPSIVHKVAQELLEKGDKNNANKLFRAYNSENLLTNDLNLLHMMYSSSNVELMEKFKDSFLYPQFKNSNNKTLEEVMYEALDLVVFRIVMENVDTRNEITEIKSSLNDRINVLRESYIKEVLSEHENMKCIKDWFSRNIYPIEFNEHDLWEYLLLKTKSNNTAYIIISDMLINVFTNILKYGEKSAEKGYLEIAINDKEINGLLYIELCFKNPIDNSQVISRGEGIGINSIRNCLKKINSTCEDPNCNINPVETEISNGIYAIKIYICSEAVSTMREDTV